MTRYLLIASRDPFAARDVAATWDFAATLANADAEVTIFLVQNGVLAARPSQESRRLSELARSGVLVLADEVSLRERGIRRERLAPGVEPATLEVVIDQLAGGRTVLWQ